MPKLKIEDESKRDRFKRIASFRTNRILDDLRLLGNCSNTSAYSYSNEDLRKIFGAIDAEVKRVRSLFISKKRRKIEL